MKRLFVLIFILCASLEAENVLVNLAGTPIPPGDFVSVSSSITGLTGTTGPYYTTGWDKYMYVPALDAYCGIGSYYQPSSEPNQNWSCYSFKENRWWMQSMSGLFADEHLQEGGHPMGNVQVDPAQSVALGFQGSSGSQVSNQTKYGMWKFDFLGDVGIPQQPLMGATINNQLGTSTYDPARMLQIGFGGDSSSQGHYQYDNNPAHATCTSNGYNCYNSWALEMPVTLNSLPVGIMQESIAENTSDGKAYLFGGFYAASSGHNGVWTYTPGTAGAAGTWTNVFTDGTATSSSCHDRLGGTNCPVGRIDAGWAYDAADNIFMMTGGALANSSSSSPQSPLNDTWIYDPVANSWTQTGFTNLTAHTFGYQESNRALSGNILSTDTTFTIASGYSYTVTASATQAAIFQIDSEFIICVAQTSQTVFSSCTRGYENTTPASHTSAALVYNSAPLSVSNERLIWLPEHNVFILFASGGMYAFAYAPGENAGHDVKSYGYTASAVSIGPLNRNTTNAANEGWTYSEAVASDGTNLFLAHTETATTQHSASPANSWLLHPYVQQFTGSSPCGTLDSGYSCLGSSYSSVSPDLNGNATNSYQISCAVISAAPWCYWYQTNVSTAGGGGTSLATIGMGVGWNGTSWSLGGQIPVAATGAGYAGPGQMINVGGTPTVIYVEQDHDGSISGNQAPYATWCYVRQWNGTAWTIVGGAPLNSGYSFCEEPTIATDGTNIWAAFTYHTITFSGSANDNGIWTGPPQIQLWYWNGSTWTQQGASGNVLGSGCTGALSGTAPPVPVGTACSRAFNPSLTVVGGVPYVSFTERTDQQTVQKLELRKFSGGAWSTVVSDLRRDSNAGWAFRPELTNDGTTLYLTWDEQGNDQPWLSGISLNTPRGQKDKVYADQITTAGVVTKLGGTLNADTVAGSASHPSVAVYNSLPVVTWGETNIGAARQLYAKRWNGSDWIAVGSASTQATPVITWTNPASIAYGTALSSTQLDATASVPGTFAYNPVTGTVLNAGNNQNLSVTFTPTDTTDYTTATKTVQINVTVTQATPVITWTNPAGITYGTALSATQLNATASVPGTFAYNPMAGTVLNAGNNQNLSVTFTPTDTTDYTTATKTVQINVTQATLVITWTNPAAITYGTALSATQLNATASVPGTFVYNPVTGTVLNAGNNQNLSVTFTPTDTTDYTTATKTVQINVTVTQATPVITWTNPAAITYGTALSATQLNATASVPGTFAYNPVTGTVLNAGNNQNLSVTFTPTDTTDYTTATKTVQVNVNVAVAGPGTQISGFASVRTNGVAH